MKEWAVHEAKAKFSSVLKSSKKEPQGITSHDKLTAVILSLEEYNKLKKPKKTLFEQLTSSKYKGDDFEFERDKRPYSRMYEVDLNEE